MIPGVSRCMYCLVASIFVEVVPGFVDGIVTLELLYSGFSVVNSSGDLTIVVCAPESSRKSQF
eukprot:m.120904 g.120904  ORF g.120904 m.120904 type:complete len:63 (-) comp9375_c0_seq14:478-666(-)